MPLKQAYFDGIDCNGQAEDKAEKTGDKGHEISGDRKKGPGEGEGRHIDPLSAGGFS